MNLSQFAFGSLANVSKDAQLNYESGARVPDATYLMALLDAGVDVQYVLTGTRTTRCVLTAEQQSLLDNYENADEEGRAAARRVLSSLAQQKAA